jgi:hypothetical protein
VAAAAGVPWFKPALSSKDHSSRLFEIGDHGNGRKSREISRSVAGVQVSGRPHHNPRSLPKNTHFALLLN